jgi:hypothetical protein
MVRLSLSFTAFVFLLVLAVIARSVSDEAIQTGSADPFWIASRSLSSGRASRGPVGSQ